MLPGSRSPRTREPMTKSCSPEATGPTMGASSAGSSLPSPSIKAMTRHSGAAARRPARQAAPYPARGSIRTRAPASSARATVSSGLPPSTTITSSMIARGTARTTSPIVSPSLRTGITSATPGLTVTRPPLKAPTQPAIRARSRRRIGKQRRSERPIRRPVPDLLQGLLGRIAERVVLVTALRKRCDAARQRSAVGREVHQRPRPPAQRPRRIAFGLPEAQSRLGGCAGRVEGDAERPGEILRLFEVDAFHAGQLLEQRLIRPRHADRVLVEKDQALQMDFLHADIGRYLDEGRQLFDRLLQAGQPGGDKRFVVSFALLQLPECTDVLENAVEIIPAADRAEARGIGRVQ